MNDDDENFRMMSSWNKNNNNNNRDNNSYGNIVENNNDSSQEEPSPDDCGHFLLMLVIKASLLCDMLVGTFLLIYGILLMTRQQATTTRTRTTKHRCCHMVESYIIFGSMFVDPISRRIFGAFANNQGQLLLWQTLWHLVQHTSNFDTELNRKPPIGARIVAVNGEAVKESWTLAELLEQLRAGDTKTTSVTFRNDLLSEKQQELLSMSSEDFQVFTDSNKRARKDKATSEPSQQEVSKQSGFHFGFLNMGGSGVPAAETKGEMTKSNKKYSIPNTISSETNTTGLKEANNRGRHAESAKGERSSHGFGFWVMGGRSGKGATVCSNK